VTIPPNHYLINEQTSFQISQTFKAADNTNVQLADLTSLTLTLYDAKTGTAIRTAQNVKNANGGSFHATSGVFVMTFTPTDTTLITPTEAEEHHVAEFTAGFVGGGATWETHLWIRNLNLAAVVSPDLVPHALLTLAEARETLGLTTAAENPLLARLINTVTDDLETLTGRRLKTRTYTTSVTRVRLEHLREEGWAWTGLEWPITTLTSVEVDDTAQTLWVPGDVGDPEDFDVYLLDDRPAPHSRDRLYRTSGWMPGSRVVVTYTAGYGTAANPIPSDLRDLVQARLRERYRAETRMTDDVQSRSTGGESVSYGAPGGPGQWTRMSQTLASYRRWA
jgi:uncharacterized phiE125 gp8 family phage protein